MCKLPAEREADAFTGAGEGPYSKFRAPRPRSRSRQSHVRTLERRRVLRLEQRRASRFSRQHCARVASALETHQPRRAANRIRIAVERILEAHIRTLVLDRKILGGYDHLVGRGAGL